MPGSRPAVVRTTPTRLPPMAQFPQGLRQIESRCNAGERRVLDQLRREQYVRMLLEEQPAAPKRAP